METSENTKPGVLYALAAYSVWGVAPVYFVFVQYALPLEILAHRILWSIPLLMILLFAGRQWSAIRSLDRHAMGRLLICAVLLTVNWLTFIYAISIGRIAETSLGYFINPLVSIVLGTVFLGERMRPIQWLAGLIALCGVAVELVMLGELPWLGLSLAFSFGFYGLLRKQINVPSAAGLGVETAMVAPFAALYIAWVYAAGNVEERSVAELALLGVGGLVTVVPLICFAAAAIRLPLTVLGFFQYLAPSLSLLLAVFVYDEFVAAPRWVCFALIWLAIAIFSLESLYHHRFLRREAT